MLIALAFVPLLAMAAPKQLIDLQVYPKDANLFTKRGKQLMVVQAKYSDSTSRDVTAEAKFSFADSKFAKLEKNTLLPLADEKEFEVELQNGVLQVVFEGPPPAKFVVSPNAPVRQVWVSALSRSFKLSWDEGTSVFSLDGESLDTLIERLAREHLARIP